MDGRALSELKVADLRRELEKRQKDKSGVKQVLVDRLREALEEDGHDPTSFRFGGDSEVHGDVEVTEQLSVNGDDVDPDKSSHKEPASHERMEHTSEDPKKLTEESVPYVVQVGDQEEDLDYDLKVEVNDQTPDKKRATDTNKIEETSASQLESGKNPKVSNDSRRNIWVSNLPKSVKAADLKQHFCKVGKVISATVVMSTKSPGGCFGFLEMGSAEDAANAARKLDGTEFDGHKLSVESTERKPPTLTPKISERSGASRSKPNASKAETNCYPTKKAGQLSYRRPPASAGRYATLRRNDRRSSYRRNAGEKREGISSRFPRPLRLNPSILAYQSLKRASRLLAASRYGIMKGLQRTVEHTMSQSRMLRAPVVMPRPVVRYSADMALAARRFAVSERRELRSSPRLEPPARRADPHPMSVSERRRSMETSYSVGRSRRVSSRMTPPRRSEPGPREVVASPRFREPPMVSPTLHRRLSQPSLSRSFDSGTRYDKIARPIDGSRSFMHPSDTRSRLESRSDERMDSLRSRVMPGENRHLSQPQLSLMNYDRFKSPFTRMLPRQGSPVTRPQSSKEPFFRREYRDISRSPPRSRTTPFNRSYPDSSERRIGRVSRDRSPLRAPGTGGSRPKVVDYGHRSEPRGDWSVWRSDGPSIPTPSGHTWKPAGHAMLSNYAGRGSGRRYI